MAELIRKGVYLLGEVQSISQRGIGVKHQTFSLGKSTSSGPRELILAPAAACVIRNSAKSRDG